jgi:hypothetical protein
VVKMQIIENQPFKVGDIVINRGNYSDPDKRLEIVGIGRDENIGYYNIYVKDIKGNVYTQHVNQLIMYEE